MARGKFRRSAEPSAHPVDLRRSQRLLLTRKIHVQPGADRRLPDQAKFTTGWGGGIHIVTLLGGLPDPLLAWWAAQEAGHILLTADEWGYVPGELGVGNHTLTGVARVPLAALVTEPLPALAASLWPLDHLLGCGAVREGPWLSSGGGLTPIWTETGERIHELFTLGYGLSPAGIADPRAYLAEGAALALTDPRHLNTRDPKLHRLLTASLLSSGFCKHHLPPADGQDRAAE